jgi:hypothetical protein
LNFDRRRGDQDPCVLGLPIAALASTAAVLSLAIGTNVHAADSRYSSITEKDCRRLNVLRIEGSEYAVPRVCSGRGGYKVFIDEEDLRETLTIGLTMRQAGKEPAAKDRFGAFNGYDDRVEWRSGSDGNGLARRLAIFTDSGWTDWLPTYAWVIDHREGIIVVDTGQGAHLRETGKSLHPYIRWEVEFRIDPEQEIGPRLRTLGIAPRDVKQVILTHLHMDHDGGLAHFPNSEILVAPGELRTARGWLGRLRGYLPNRWPSWFDPVPLRLSAEPFGIFPARRRLTKSDDVVVVATPGHTANHLFSGRRCDVLPGRRRLVHRAAHACRESGWRQPG